MVIHDLDVVRPVLVPLETDAPLPVDSNAVLARAPAGEKLQLVAGWNAERVDPRGSVDLQQLPVSGTLDVARQLFRMLAIERLLRLRVLEALDHESILAHDAINVTRYY